MRTTDRKLGVYASAKYDPLLTPAKLLELQKNLEDLKKNKRPKAMLEVQRLAEMGDFSENFGYQVAKGQLRGINNAIMKIEAQINQAEIISPGKNSDRVRIGHTVTLHQIAQGEPQGKEKTFQILGSVETNPSTGIISHNSPLGSALLGHKVGKTVSVSQGDKKIEWKILRIE